MAAGRRARDRRRDLGAAGLAAARAALRAPAVSTSRRDAPYRSIPTTTIISEPPNLTGPLSLACCPQRQSELGESLAVRERLSRLASRQVGVRGRAVGRCPGGRCRRG